MRPWVWVLVAGCVSLPKLDSGVTTTTPPAGDADTDADADTDSDADSDTDTDTDTDTADSAAETADTGGDTGSPFDTGWFAAAGPIWAAAGRGTGRRLYRLDPLTGDVTSIGLERPYTDLTTDGAGGVYGVVGHKHRDRGHVYRIDTSTGVESFLFTVPQDDEYALALMPAGTFLTAEEDGAWAVVDGAGTSLIDGETSLLFDAYGAGLSIDADGVPWYAAGDHAYSWTGAGFSLEFEIRSELVRRNGGGAGWHGGLLLLTEVDEYTGVTNIFAVDQARGTVAPTGWTLPSTEIDAITSETP